MGDDPKPAAPEPWPTNAPPASEEAPASDAPAATEPAAEGVSSEAVSSEATPAESVPPTTPPAPVKPPQPVKQRLPLDPNAPRSLEDKVLDVLGTIYDPEIPVNIYELGLIYELTVDEDAGSVIVRMTLTSPSCPVAGTLPGEVEQKIREVEGVESVDLALVWEPPWDKDRLSEAAKLQLGLL